MTTKQKNLTKFNFIQPTRLRHSVRVSARCEFNPDIGYLIFPYVPNMVLSQNECSNALYNTNHKELHVSTLMGFCLDIKANREQTKLT